MLESIVNILMTRDGMTREEANEELDYCRQLVADGENPEDVLHDELGLEPDCIYELL